MAAKRGKSQARRSGGKGGGGGARWLFAGLAIGALVFGYLHFREQMPWSKPASTLPTPDPNAHVRASGDDNGLADVPEKPKPKYDFYDLLPEREVVIPDAELDAQARAEAAARSAAQLRAEADAEAARNATANGTSAATGASAGTPTGAPGAPAGVASTGVGGNAPPATGARADTPAAAGAAAAAAPPATPVASTLPTSHGERYLIQAGAFRGSAEADALKAKIAMTGEIARVETAEINGTTVHRVRMGPYPDASALAAAKRALASHGITAQAIKVR